MHAIIINNDPELSRIKDQLKALVDKMGVDIVLSLVETICDDKAEDIEANGQDKTTARAWARIGRIIERSARMASATL